MKTCSQISCSVLVLILSLALGCSKKASDAQITSDVQTKFSQDSGLSTKQIGVQSDKGVVTLSGNVDDNAQRDAAARQAASVPGVKEVVNNLVVGAAPATAANDSVPPNTRSERGKPRRSREKNADASPSQDLAGSTAPQTMAASAPPADNTPPPPPPPRKYTIDQGTQLTVRLIDPIDSEKNQTGDTFHATLKAPLTSDGDEAVPSGVELSGHLVSVKSAGKFAGQSEVVLQLDSLSSGGRTYNIQTDQYKKTGSSRGKNTAEKVGGGALVGTLIGALAGGGKGAAIGAAAGAGIGGGVQAATKGQQIKLPSETVLSFTLQAPITVVEAASPDANRQKLSNQ